MNAQDSAIVEAIFGRIKALQVRLSMLDWLYFNSENTFISES